MDTRGVRSAGILFAEAATGARVMFVAGSAARPGPGLRKMSGMALARCRRVKKR